MTMLTQQNMNAAHQRLDNLINTALRASREACDMGDTDTRNKLDMVASHLLAARSVAGTLKMQNGVVPQFGGKD